MSTTVTDRADRATAFAGPAALAALVRSRETTPRELVELYLRRIEALDPRLNAFRVTLAELALAEAGALDGARLAGPLAGVPIAVKDDIAVAGQVTTKGTRVRVGDPPEEPPGVRDGSHGLRVIPFAALAVHGKIISSGTFVIPTGIAPAARRRRIASASAGAGGSPTRTRVPWVAT